MKYLQLYDHLGNLVKEFEVYVDGQDFSWGAQKPEPVWLGTIKIASERATRPIEPTPGPEAEVVEPEAAIKELEAQQEAIAERKTREIEIIEEAEVEPQAPFITPSTTTEKLPESEVKHEPKKRSYKGSRGKRASSQSSS